MATSKITGEEDRYSHTDLWDFAANVAGAKAAVDALRPALTARDAALMSDVDTKFATVQTLLDKQKVGDGYKLYTALTEADTKALADSISGLAEPISKVAAAISTSRPVTLEVTVRRSTMERRRVLGLAGAGAAGLVAAGAVGAAVRGSAGGDDLARVAGAVDFYGEHQAGIVTPAQDRLHVVAFDVITTDRAALVRLLKDWTAAAARLTAGRDAGPVGAVDGAAAGPAGRHRRGARTCRRRSSR